jgi:hypothetical protein
MKTTGLTSRHKRWDMTSVRLLLVHNESLILARNKEVKEGHQLLHLACWRLRRICNVPVINQNKSLTTDFLNIIDELEVNMANARWIMFQYMIKSGLTNIMT